MARKRERKVPLNTRVTEKNHERIEKYRRTWGESIEGTINRIIRGYDKKRKKIRELRAELAAAKQQVQDLNSHIAALQGRINFLEGEPYNVQMARYYIESFHDFKVEYCNWDPDLAQAEMKPLNDFLTHLMSGKFAVIDDDDEEDEFEDEEDVPKLLSEEDLEDNEADR